MEYFIGQEIELIHNGKNITIKVEEGHCDECMFHTIGYRPCKRVEYHLSDAFCSSMARKDKKNIIYKQIK